MRAVDITQMGDCKQQVKTVTLEATLEGLKMEEHIQSLSGVCTARHYAVGIHYAWECAVHEAAREFFIKNSFAWIDVDRKAFIDHYFRVTPYALANKLRSCGVCAPAIADAIIAGTQCPAIDLVSGQRLIRVDSRLVAKENIRRHDDCDV